MRLKIILAILVFCTMSCNRDYTTYPNPDWEWVAINPIQCMGNPWERDWLESHNWDYAAYPSDPTEPGLEPEVLNIIKDFYKRHGVTVFSGERANSYESVCAACSCPAGYTLYLLIEEENIQKMIEFGYRNEDPR